jgi:hypothetical protein
MRGSLVTRRAAAFSGASGSVGDLADVPFDETVPTVEGVSWTFCRRATVAGVAGNPDRRRGVALMAFRTGNLSSSKASKKGWKQRGESCDGCGS